MDLQDYREQIDEIDDELLRLFSERMGVSRQIALFKKARSLPAMDARREEEKLAMIGEKAPEELRQYTRELFLTLFRLSRDFQESFLV